MGRYVLFSFLVACGGMAVDPVDGSVDAQHHDGSNVDGGFFFEAGIDSDTFDASCTPNVCPSSPPTTGSACSGQYDCEYGTSARSWCNTLARCGGTKWQVLPAPDGGPCAPNAQCPATIADAVDAGATCGTSNFTCYYDEGTCGCSSGSWKCALPSSSCPTQRPRIGTACSGPSACSYGIFCTNLNGDMLVCSCGSWEEAYPPLCPP